MNITELRRAVVSPMDVIALRASRSVPMGIVGTIVVSTVAMEFEEFRPRPDRGLVRQSR